MIQTPAGQNFDVRIKRALDYFQPGYGVAAMTAGVYGEGTAAGVLLGQEPSGMAIDFVSITPNMLVRSTNSFAASYYSGVPFGTIYQQNGPVSFTRTTNATVIDSDGAIKWAAHNLLLASEQFDNSNWAKTTTTITANSIAAPNGTTTADTLAAAGANSTTLQTYTAIAAPYTFNIWLRRKTGTGNIQIAADSGTYTTVAITSDWALYTVAQTPTAGSKTAGIRIVTSGDEVYAWGAHIYRSDLSMQANTSEYPMYNPTTAKNTLGFTENFDNTSWLKARASVSANVITAPNGLLTADKIVEDTATNSHVIYRATGGTGGRTTLSAYAKAAERTFLCFETDAAGTQTYFNLSTGQLGTVGANVTAAISLVGDGWYRCSITGLLTGNAYIGPALANGSVVYTGNGTSGIYLWGAQFSDSASLDPYVANNSTAPSAAAYYGPRLDFDPVSIGTCKGFLVEDQRTNSLLNTATLSTQNVTVSATPYTLSFYGTGTVTLSGASTAGPLVGTGAYPNRVTLTFTPTAGTLTLTVSGTVSQAQLEAGSFATSYIPVGATTAGNTRNADVAVLFTQTFPYNGSEGTVISSFNTFDGTSGLNRVFALTDGTNTNRTEFRNSSASEGLVVSGGATSATLNTANITTNTVTKAALAYKASDFAATVGGAAPATVSSGAVSVGVDRLNIGTSSTGISQLNGWIRQITYIPRRVSNAELVARSA